MECEASGSVTRRKCYLVNCALPGGTACDTRSFIAVQNINHVSRRLIRRTMCAMMNLGQTSTIFIGVLKDGIVKGVKLTKTEVKVLKGMIIALRLCNKYSTVFIT